MVGAHVRTLIDQHDLRTVTDYMWQLFKLHTKVVKVVCSESTENTVSVSRVAGSHLTGARVWADHDSVSP